MKHSLCSKKRSQFYISSNIAFNDFKALAVRAMASTGQRQAQREAEHREVDGRHHRLPGQIHRHLLAHPQHSRSLSGSRQEVLDI